MQILALGIVYLAKQTSGYQLPHQHVGSRVRTVLCHHIGESSIYGVLRAIVVVLTGVEDELAGRADVEAGGRGSVARARVVELEFLLRAIDEIERVPRPCHFEQTRPVLTVVTVRGVRIVRCA